MSEVVRHIGKVRKADLQGLNTEEWCKKKCEELGVEKGSSYDTYEEAMLDEPYPAKVVKVNGEFWEVLEDRQEEDYEDLAIMLPDNDGTFNYILQFYNGGTCLSEMLEEEIKKINKRSKEK